MNIIQCLDHFGIFAVTMPSICDTPNGFGLDVTVVWFLPVTYDSAKQGKAFDIMVSRETIVSEQVA
jgi:hypothetical protein